MKQKSPCFSFMEWMERLFTVASPDRDFMRTVSLYREEQHDIIYHTIVYHIVVLAVG